MRIKIEPVFLEPAVLKIHDDDEIIKEKLMKIIEDLSNEPKKNVMYYERM